MLIHLIFFFGTVFSSVFINALSTKELVIIILSQDEGDHYLMANVLQQNIEDQAANISSEAPRIDQTNRINMKGSWTIIPILHYLDFTYPNTKWFFFCIEDIVIDLSKLLTVLSSFNSSQELFIGHALYDDKPTIIHHFARQKKFKYPHFGTGFALTSNLLKRISESVRLQPTNDFSIDPAYELADYIFKSQKPVKLTHVPELCVVATNSCATYPRVFHPRRKEISLKNIYFAVKTCSMYHNNRIPIIKKTWAKHAVNIGYFSDQSDSNLPEAFVVTNTTKGHCAKTYDILQKVIKILESKNIDWLIISDDDTLFSVARLMSLLKNYFPKHSIAIGERYGYHVSEPYGYDYLTGGAGIILSTPLIYQILDVCKCPSASTPDDMFLFGICLENLRIKPTHSYLLHQARPVDYATAYLASQEPISFHKFWEIDPIKVYNQWFYDADSSLTKKRTEL
ncbi:PREDICTED: beta-1,3-glucosyltransferase isoform X2 [Polistes dominula]|uniref:Beta-1,3-glucosyltransferase isoform X2 n=1 Tax=Polistes dominula TaxID=743375 RepID=A0ABM1IG75_POLDO|nr:PREDICTED: beta-1,3-glucosyltransferase isoform X2 [Polistes dominula]XP_015179221.1 PREDICTED: beta-1,3-glucosyltransferase isoform X2 [Polistes dominula]